MERFKAFKTKDHNICLVPLEFMWKKPNTIRPKNLEKATWTNHHRQPAQEIQGAASPWKQGKDLPRETHRRCTSPSIQGAYFADAFPRAEAAFRGTPAMFAPPRCRSPPATGPGHGWELPLLAPLSPAPPPAEAEGARVNIGEAGTQVLPKTPRAAVWGPKPTRKKVASELSNDVKSSRLSAVKRRRCQLRRIGQRERASVGKSNKAGNFSKLISFFPLCQNADLNKRRRKIKIPAEEKDNFKSKDRLWNKLKA